MSDQTYRNKGGRQSPGSPEPSRGVPDGAIVGLLAVLLGTTALVWTSTALAGLATHGHLPHPLPFEDTPEAIRQLATGPGNLAAAWSDTPAAQLPSATAFWTVFAVLLAVLLAVVLTILTAWTRLRRAARDSVRTTAGTRDTEPEPGAGQGAGPLRGSTASAAAPVHRPPADLPAPRSVPSVPATPAVPAAPTVTAPAEPPAEPAPNRPFALPAGAVCLLTPDPVASAPAKHRLLHKALHSATGPVLVVSDDLGLWEDRPPHRDARLFDPLQLVDADSETRVRWAPHNHCEDPAVALSRARALLFPTRRGGDSAGERDIQETAQTLLRCWLHAAALDGRPFRHVLRWATGTARHEAVTVLRTADPLASGPGWAGELQAALSGTEDMREAAFDRVLSALDGLSDLHVLKACSPGTPQDSLDLDSFLQNRGTLYVVGRGDESRVSRATHSAMPLLTALVEDVVEHGRRTAVRSASGRLDPPLLCVLDRVAAVAPFPGLPDLMARGGPLGLNVLTVLRSPEQARARWGERALHSLWTNSDAGAVLGPARGPVALPGGSTGSSGTPGTPSGQAPGPEAEAGLAQDELLLLRPRHPAERFQLPPDVIYDGSAAAKA